MNHGPLLIGDDDALARFVSGVGPGPVAVDTEADSMHHYREKVCLIQISCAGRDALVDPLAGVDLRLLARVLGDPAIQKILHGADYDLRILGRDHALRVHGVFDTMIAARLSGERSFGLAALLSSFLGVKLNKAHQRADWSRRPLSAGMIAYAAGDTRHLEELAGLLAARLATLGRTAWAEEEFRRLEQVKWQRTEDPEPFRRVKDASTLDRRALGILREVHAFRERLARDRDLPPFRVVVEEALLGIARARPQEPQALASIHGFPRPLLAGPLQEELLAAVRRAIELPEDQLPELRLGVRPKPDPAFAARMAAVQARRDALAEGLGLDPSLIASRAVLEAALRAHDRGEGLAAVPDLRHWQAELLAGVF